MMTPTPDDRAAPGWLYWLRPPLLLIALAFIVSALATWYGVGDGGNLVPVSALLHHDKADLCAILAKLLAGVGLGWAALALRR